MASPDDDPPGRHYASPPCMAHEIDPAYFDPLAVDPEQARDVARWREAERARLRAARQAWSAAARAAIEQALISHLRLFLDNRPESGQGRILASYWPINGEPDLRPLMTELDTAGVVLALPLVETRAGPLVFRRWRHGTRMLRGNRGIPVPPPEAPVVTPEIVLVPLVGWDGAGYRLGRGGGYFDRTLAALSPRPFAIGIGVQAARLPTIYPQPHEIALDVIVTEAGVQVDSGRAS